jgi:hypothetical protein
MKYTAISILLVLCSIPLFSQSWTRPADAAKHLGDTVNLFGFISNIKFAHDGQHTLIVGIPSSKDSSRFLSLILSKTAGKEYVEDLKTTYLNQYVLVRGMVEIITESKYRLQKKINED